MLPQPRSPHLLAALPVLGQRCFPPASSKGFWPAGRWFDPRVPSCRAASQHLPTASVRAGPLSPRHRSGEPLHHLGLCIPAFPSLHLATPSLKFTANSPPPPHTHTQQLWRLPEPSPLDPESSPSLPAGGSESSSWVWWGSGRGEGGGGRGEGPAPPQLHPLGPRPGAPGHVGLLLPCSAPDPSTPFAARNPVPHTSQTDLAE